MFNDVLVESIDETISDLLSRAVVDALYAHLQTFHSISRDRLPDRLDALLTSLVQIFGDHGTETITRAIARKFYLKLGLEFKYNPNRTLLEYVDEARMELQTLQSKEVGACVD